MKHMHSSNFGVPVLNLNILPSICLENIWCVCVYVCVRVFVDVVIVSYIPFVSGYSPSYWKISTRKVFCVRASDMTRVRDDDNSDEESSPLVSKRQNQKEKTDVYL